MSSLTTWREPILDPASLVGPLLITITLEYIRIRSIYPGSILESNDESLTVFTGLPPLWIDSE